MKKKYLILMIACLIILSWLVIEKVNLKQTKILTLSIFPRDTSDDTYLYEVFKNKKIIITKGVRDWDIWDSRKEIQLKEIEIEKKMTISKKEFNSIIMLINEIDECGNMNIDNNDIEIHDVLEVWIATEKNRLNRLTVNSYEECDKVIYKLCKRIEDITKIGFSY